MGGFAGWIAGIVGAVIATTIIDLMMAEGETKKFIKGIASLLILAVIIAPLPALINNDFKLIEDTAADEKPGEDLMEDYLRRVYLHRYKNYELAIQNKLKAKGMDEVIVRIDIAHEGGQIVIKSVNVDTSKMVLTGNSTNIDINGAILEAVESVLGRAAAVKTVIK